jgi:uncharacterized membrane protein YwzB
MNFFATAIAEATPNPEMTAVVTNAAKAGTILGLTMFSILLIAIVWYVLQAIADWKIFTKAGEAGWKSLIPFYNIFVEYDLSWNAYFGLAFIAATLITTWIGTMTNAPSWVGVVSTILGVVTCVLHAIQSVKLAKAFDKGTGFGILLFIFGPIFRMILGFGSASYVGPQ